MDVKKQDFYNLVGDKIYKERLRIGITQEQLAIKTGLSRKSVNRYENGVTHINTYALYKIARALKVDIKKLFPSPNNLTF